MLNIVAIAQGVLERGLIFGIVICAVYISSRVIRFTDLSVEGSFGIGGALMACMVAYSLPLSLGFVCAIFAGCMVGLATGLLHTKVHMNALLSGIVVTSASFSVMLKLAGANISLPEHTMLVHFVPTALSFIGSNVFLLPIAIGIVIALRWFLQTQIGFLMQAVGDNPQLVTNLGKNKDYYIVAGLMLSNGLTAFAGALFVVYLGYFSIWSSIGLLIMALAGLILASALSNKCNMALIAGACLYQAIIACTFALHIDQTWNKLITAVLIVALIVVKQFYGSKDDV